MSNFIRNTIAFMFSLLGVVYSANALESGGIDINYDVVRAAGMGNTGAGISMGAGSVFLNPGALSLQYDNEILITGTGWVSYTAYRDRTPSLYSTVSKPQWNTPFGMYAVFRPNRQNRFAFGLSINSPFSIKTAWKNDWKGRAIVNNYVFNTVIIQPTLSIRVSEKVGIGLGVMYCRGGLWADKIIPDLSTPSNTESTMRIYGNGQGWGINFGTFVRWNERFSMGINARTPINIHIQNGRVSLDALKDSRNLPPFTTFKTQLPLPYLATVGIGYRSFRQLLVTSEISYTGWNLWDSTVIRYDSLSDKLPANARHVNLRNTLTFKSGVEWNMPNHLALRLGAYYSLSPVRNGFVSPEYPDANRIGVTGGIGIRVSDNFNIELNGKYEATGERTFTFTQEGFSGIYKMNGYSAGVSFGYRF